MRRAFKLGVYKTTPWDLSWVGPLGRTETDIQGAISRLLDPVLRIHDRLFWFHDGEDLVGSIKSDSLPAVASLWHSASSPTASHDAAAMDLLTAMLLDPELKDEKQWSKALAAWSGLVESDDYWSALIVSEKEAFEPSALVTEIEQLRKQALGLVADIVGSVARGALARDDYGTCHRALRILREGHLPEDVVFVLEDEIFGPLEENLETICGNVRREGGDNIKKDRESALANHAVCEKAIDRFEREIEPQFKRLLLLSRADSDVAQRIREVAASCLYGLAIDCTWADKFRRAEDLLIKAYELATSVGGEPVTHLSGDERSESQTSRGESVVATRIRESLDNVARGAKQERLYKDLKPIKGAPSLRTFNGFGFRLYGKSEIDLDTGSYMSTYYFVALFIPVIPICRYRVVDAGANSYSFLGKAPLRKFDRWHLGLVLVGLLGFIIMNQDRNTNVSPKVTDSPPVAGSRSPSETLAGTENSQDNLRTLKERMNLGRNQIQALEGQLKTIEAEIDRLKSQINTDADQIRKTRNDAQLGLGVDESAYNQLVNEHNALVPTHNERLSEFKRIYTEYKKLLEEDGRLVERYNKLVRR